MKTKQNISKFIIMAGLCVAGSAGADSNSDYFDTVALPKIQDMVAASLQEGVAHTGVTPIDTATLTIATRNQPIHVYFISEGAAYANIIGVTENKVGGSKRSTDLFTATTPPMTAGDFYLLKNLQAKSVLDFYLISNGANGGKDKFGSLSAGSDGLMHVIGLNSPVNAYNSDSGYLILGFEDTLGGGDGDYNDVIIAIEGLNVAVATPEPALWMTLGTFGLMGLMAWRRKQAA
jgi:hypothetical protein